MEDREDALRAGVPTPHSGQERVLNLPGRVRVAVCGRRFGKTYAAAIAAVRKCQEDATPKRVWWIAPVQAQADAVEEEIAGWLDAKSGRAPTKRKDEKKEDEAAVQSAAATIQEDCGTPGWYHLRSAHELHYAGNGSRIEFHSAHVPDRLRGAGLDLVVVDEAADVSEYAWNKVVRPMLFDRGGEAFIIGTPRGTQNWLHRVYLMGQSAEHAGRYASLQLPTSANERIVAEELEAYRREMTAEEFAQECEAQFIDGVEAVFTNVAEAANGEPLTRGRPGVTYITGVDLGDRADYTALCSVAADTERLEGFARLNKVGWTEQVERITTHLALFPGVCVVDTTGIGDPVLAALQDKHRGPIVPFMFSTENKENVVRGLSIAFDSRTISLPNIPVLIGELQAFRRLKDGRENGLFHRRYGAPSGLHDDCVIALALAWWALKTGKWGARTGNPWQYVGLLG